MAANAGNFGFMPVGTLTGTPVPKMVLRPTGDSAKGKNDTSIFIGDVVNLDASGAIQRINDAASGGDSRLPLGVVGAVFDVNRRPFTFNQPDSGSFIPTSTRGFVGVYESPHIIYRANCSSTASYLNVGAFCAVRVCAATTLVGRSGMGVDLGANTAATAAGEFLKLYNISPMDGLLDEARLSGQANQDVEVVIVNSQWSNAWLRNIVAEVDVSSWVD